MIEIPKNSKVKYEFDKTTKSMKIDRVLQQSYPEAYGFIEGTLAQDGDPLDLFLITSKALPSGKLVDIKDLHICGYIDMIDNGSPDEKLVAFFKSESFLYGSFDNTLVSEELRYLVDPIIKFLNEYKPGVELKGFFGAEKASDLIQEYKIK
jgi:inorganic pyrophosphatase